MKASFNIMSGLLIVVLAVPAFGGSAAFKDNIYNPGQLKPIDSTLNVKVGEVAPDFTLPSVGGGEVTLSQHRGKKHVVISFVPAAWTPSHQSAGSPSAIVAIDS